MFTLFWTTSMAGWAEQRFTISNSFKNAEWLAKKQSVGPIVLWGLWNWCITNTLFLRLHIKSSSWVEDESCYWSNAIATVWESRLLTLAAPSGSHWQRKLSKLSELSYCCICSSWRYSDHWLVWQSSEIQAKFTLHDSTAYAQIIGVLLLLWDYYEI